LSLVMEALRRVEKPGASPGSIGAAVASYTKARARRGPAIPLLLGLASGGAVVFLFEPPPKAPTASGAALSETPRTLPVKGGAGLPPPLLPESASVRALESPADGSTEAPVAPSRGAAPRLAAASLAPTPRPVAALTLQAISERDSQPIAVINDQLVRKGDRIGLVRVLEIGPDFVDVVHENGRTETVRFASPPPLEASPTPDPR
jgi:hypothetical protein